MSEETQRYLGALQQELEAQKRTMLHFQEEKVIRENCGGRDRFISHRAKCRGGAFKGAGWFADLGGYAGQDKGPHASGQKLLATEAGAVFPSMGSTFGQMHCGLFLFLLLMHQEVATA